MTILPKKKNNQPKDGRIGGATQNLLGSTAAVSGVDHLMTVNDELGVVTGVCPVPPAISAPPHRKRANPCLNSALGGARSKNRTATNVGIGKQNVQLPVDKDEPEGPSACGYNSEDEYERSGKQKEYSDEKERKFEEKLNKSKGWIIKRMKEDGACLFRAVADQVYGDQEMHGVVRKLCMDYMVKNADHFSQFVTEDFNLYVARKRLENAHGNHTEIQALAEMYNRPIEVYQYSLEPINTFYTGASTKPGVGIDPLAAPIRVTYHGDTHYNSLVDPFAATIGVGLGLPQFQPGVADRNLLRDAEHASERDEIERAMLKDKLRVTDWEATDEQIQEQVARESYLEWIRAQEKAMKENASSNRGESTVTRPHKPKSPSTPSTMVRRSSKPASPAHETGHNDVSETAGPSHRPNKSESTSSGPAKVDRSPSLYGISQWGDDEDNMINRVLALSRQEYFDRLKNTEKSNDVQNLSETAEMSKNDLDPCAVTVSQNNF